MLTQEQNRLLTEVEGDAPMGRFMRERHWIPCARSASLVADGAPQPVRLLGRNYVAFRATDGRVGFFDEACPHRGASLLLARNEDCALRCIFHGWKFDVSGQAVEVPSEAERSASFAAKVKLNHYPTFEGGGLLWVFLGEGAPPPRPPVPYAALSQENVWITRSVTPCNWLQGVEGTLDSVHVGTLHHSWIANVQKNDGASTIGHALTVHPRYEVAETAYGIRAAAIRKLDEERNYLRVTEYVMPFISLVPNTMAHREGNTFISVPIDNHNHMLFWGFWNEDSPVDMTERGQMFYNGERDMDHFASFPTGRAGSWGQDRAAMAEGHFTGFRDCLLQEDVVVQASMGPVVDRTKEQLCASDVAIVRARRRLLDELAAFERSAPDEFRAVEAETAQSAAAQSTGIVRPVDTITPSDQAWRDLALI
ncbi:MAG: Rieske 2Fe-2S domain-containing protein [Alphaproteobacteria bacterium]|nr:Rieske 2Fe-2S domain-containing protein [Alphaproteobacteria bacterium]